MKQIISCYFATIGALLGFAVAWDNDWIPAVLLFFLIFAVCVVWFANIMRRREEMKWKNRREVSGRLNEFERELSAVRVELDRKQDKPVEMDKPVQSRVRPGSKPSIEYQNMVVERSEHDDLRGADRPAED